MLTPADKRVPLVSEDEYIFNQSEVLSRLQQFESHPAFKNFKDLEIGDAGTSAGDYDNSPHKIHELADFTNWALSRATEICKEWQFPNTPSIRHSWANKHGAGGRSKAHTHPMAHLVLAAYVKAEPNCGDLYITDPLENHWFGQPTRLARTQSMEWKYQAQTNKVVFFAPWLRHETGPNESGEDRWVLSYNFTCWPEGYNPK
jgi:hypothetical protein